MRNIEVVEKKVSSFSTAITFELLVLVQFRRDATTELKQTLQPTRHEVAHTARHHKTLYHVCL